VVVVGVIPLWGILAYLLLAEVNIGRRRVQRLQALLERMPSTPGHAADKTEEFAAAVPEQYQHLFYLGRSINGFRPVSDNTGRLLPSSNATIDAMVISTYLKNAAKRLTDHPRYWASPPLPTANITET
jgi:cardiolipin synthase